MHANDEKHSSERILIIRTLFAEAKEQNIINIDNGLLVMG